MRARVPKPLAACRVSTGVHPTPGAVPHSLPNQSQARTPHTGDLETAKTPHGTRADLGVPLGDSLRRRVRHRLASCLEVQAGVTAENRIRRGGCRVSPASRIRLGATSTRRKTGTGQGPAPGTSGRSSCLGTPPGSPGQPESDLSGRKDDPVRASEHPVGRLHRGRPR